MSEKITFQELIDSIADQTNKPKQFTYDFLKDFVEIVNSGLESDGTISIAGFGKFKLRPMDEREGYNPQTGEKFTIPAHNKVVFKPYKALRELVNAPYKHLEAELLDETTHKEHPPVTQKSDDSAPASSPLSDPDKGEQPALDEKQGKAPWEQPAEESEESHNSLRSDDDQSREVEFSDDDIVEFSPDIKITNYEKLKSSGSSSEGGSRRYDPDELRQMAASYSLQRYRQHKRRVKRRILLATAACFVLLLSVGIWHFGTSTKEGSFDLMKVDFFKTAVDTHEVSSPIPGNSGPSAPDIQIRGSEPVANSNTGRESLRPASTKQVITKGQTLWSLAGQQYNNPYLWPWIYDVNKTSLRNPDLILAGQTLAIPLPHGHNGDLSTNDSLQVAMGYIETYRWYKNHGYSKAKYYLYAARLYNGDIFDYTDVIIDDSDLTFANRAR